METKHGHQFHEREDELHHCMICDGAEGSLPSECPGTEMTVAEESAVMAGTLDFRKGFWWCRQAEVVKARELLELAMGYLR